VRQLICDVGSGAPGFPRLVNRKRIFVAMGERSERIVGKRRERLAKRGALVKRVTSLREVTR